MADVRVADRVFAPHYAQALACPVRTRAFVTATRDGDPIGAVAAGERFEVLELTVAHAWGVAQDGVVGYVALEALTTT